MRVQLNDGGSAAVSLRVGETALAKGLSLQLHQKAGEITLHPFSMPNPYYTISSSKRKLKAPHFDLEIKADGASRCSWTVSR